jgi:hypothetical protein
MTAYEKLEAKLAKHRLDAIRITTKTVKKVASGASKYGGLPDLPADVAWPVWTSKKKSYPFTFVAQVAMKDVARFDKEKVLPKTGTLSFFAFVLHHDEPFAEWKDAPWNGAHVAHIPPKAKLEKKKPPERLPADLVLPESKMTFAKQTTWPCCEGTVIGASPNTLANASAAKKKEYGGTVKLTEEEWMTWATDAPEPPALQMLGHPRSPEFPIGTSASSRLLLSAHLSANLPWEIFGRNGHMFFHAPVESIRKGKWTDVMQKRW